MGMKLDMIAAGAYSVALENGMPEKMADAMVSGILEKAAARRDDDDDDDDSTWWSRNRGWALPTTIASLAALGGIDVGRNWEPDGNVFTNPLRLWGRRLSHLLGIHRDQYQKSLINTPAARPPLTPQEALQEMFARYRAKHPQEITEQSPVPGPTPTGRGGQGQEAALYPEPHEDKTITVGPNTGLTQIQGNNAAPKPVYTPDNDISEALSPSAG